MIHPLPAAHYLRLRSRLIVLATTLLLTPTLAQAQFRTMDGTGNNLSNPTWGTAGSTLVRRSFADYPGAGNGDTILSDAERANPREISNVLSEQITTTTNTRGMTSGVWQWGQFLDHDMSLTITNSADSATILSPASDPYGMAAIPFSRSVFLSDGLGVRQQVNEISSYIDASMVYGSDATRAAALREFSGGRLRSSAGGLLLPTDDMTAALGAVPNDDGNLGAPVLFVAGDLRANEQTGLIALQTLFMREHNRLAGALSTSFAGDVSWDDERIYQTARSIVGAQVQAITYNEFLPALLGSYAPSAADYAYDSTVDASIATEFSTAFFRLGHSMLNEELMLTNAASESAGSISLRDAFFNPQLVMDNPGLVDKTLMGLMTQQSNELDLQLVDGVRNFLFTPDGGVGLDLAALNIQRGRDNGLPDYNTLRVAYGLEEVASFAEITSDATVQAKLLLLYGSVDNIDPWVGALAEDLLDGASVGELMGTALVDQFTRSRDGDRFFYTGDSSLFENDIAAMIDFSTLTLTDILAWNTDMEMSSMPGSFFMAVVVPEPGTLSLLIAVGLALPVRKTIR